MLRAKEGDRRKTQRARRMYSADLTKICACTAGGLTLSTTQQSETNSRYRPPRMEVGIIAAILVVFLLVNLVTAERSPTVWMDEVLFADPAVNMVMGNGFTSSAWPGQARDQIWAGNVPLYSLTLYPWLKLFGVSPRSVRSYNYVLVSAAALLFWIGILRLNLIRRPALRILFVCMFLLGYGITFSYRGARPDCIGILLIVALFSTWTLRRERWRWALALFLGALLPVAGLQLLPYVAVLGALIWLVYPTRQLLGYIAVVDVGMAVGFGTLYLTYQTLGIWDTLFTLVRAYSLLGGNLWGGTIERLAGFARRPMLGGGHDDFSSLLLLSAIALLGIYAIATKSGRIATIGIWGLGTGLAVPLTMRTTGHFPIYYTWMVYLPLAVAVIKMLDLLLEANRRRIVALALAIVIASMFLGLPVRLLLTAVEWRERDYEPVERAIQKAVRPGDRVYSEFGAYYPVKRIAAVCFLPDYQNQMTAADWRQTNVIVVRPSDYTKLQKRLGGEWSDTGVFTGPQPPDRQILGIRLPGSVLYDFRIYRRAGTGDRSPAQAGRFSVIK